MAAPLSAGIHHRRSILYSMALRRKCPAAEGTAPRMEWGWGCPEAQTFEPRTLPRLAARSRPKRPAKAPGRAKPLRRARRPPPADTRACYTRSPTTIVHCVTSTRTCRVEVKTQLHVHLVRNTFTVKSHASKTEEERRQRRVGMGGRL